VNIDSVALAGAFYSTGYSGDWRSPSRVPFAKRQRQHRFDIIAPMPARKRILFLAEGATMAHFVRPLALAQALDPNRYEVHFYAPSRYSHYLENCSFITGELASMPGERFLDNIAKGRPLFPAATIRDYVAQDRGLIRSIRPDLVIGDIRLSLPISARKEGVSYAAIFNAYWSPFAKRRSVVPSLPITRILPPRYFGPMYRAADPLVNFRPRFPPVLTSEQDRKCGDGVGVQIPRHEHLRAGSLDIGKVQIHGTALVFRTGEAESGDIFLCTVKRKHERLPFEFERRRRWRRGRRRLLGCDANTSDQGDGRVEASPSY